MTRGTIAHAAERAASQPHASTWRGTLVRVFARSMTSWSAKGEAWNGAPIGQRVMQDGPKLGRPDGEEARSPS
jgi:hypothetical protein